MAEISVRVESRAEAEWLWSRLLGARIEDAPLRVVVDARLGGVHEAIERGLRQRMLTRAWLESLDSAPRL